MNQETNKIIESGLIEITKADYIVSKFKSYTELAEEWATKATSIVVTDESQIELISQAKEGKMLLKSKRIEIEKIRKALKEQSLNEGRLIDSVAKSLTSLIEPAEKHLELQEKFVEIRERERKLQLAEDRTKALGMYYEVISVDTLQLDIMTDEAFESILKFCKKELIEKRENERIKEEEKYAQLKAEQEEKLRVNTENEKLKKEAAEREVEIENQRQKTALIQKELDEANASIALKNIEVTGEEYVLSEIEKINAKVEEVCPTPNTNTTLIDLPFEQDIEIIIGMERQIKKLKEDKDLAIKTLDFALVFIIHDNLRLNIESTLKELKK